MGKYKGYTASRKRANLAQKLKVTKLIIAAKAKPCADCNVEYPFYVMQFDHLPGQVKLFQVNLNTGACRSVKAVLAEILKCEVVCANCHAERTHGRL